MSGKQKNKAKNPGAAAKPDAGAASTHFDVEDALTTALAHHQAGRLDEAEPIYREILRVAPEHLDALHLLGLVALQRGDHDAAVELIEKALAANPSIAEIHNSLGNALQAQGRLNEALESYHRALALNPDLVGAYINLGNTLKAQDKLIEAIASYEQALALEPDAAEVHNNLGIALFEKGDLEGAAASLQRALALKPDQAEACNRLGVLLKGLGRYDEAEKSLKRALDLKPDDTQARYHHATVHKFVPGDPEIEKLKELIERKGFSEDQRNPLLFALGKAYDDTGLYAEAFSYYRQANDEKARRVKFNASRYRKQIIEIKQVFRQHRRSASKSLGEAEHVPVFVVGMSNSGKTLVESLLSQHEDVFGAGESSKWINSIGKVLEKYSISEPFPNFMGLLVDDKIIEMGKTYMEEISKYSPASRFFVNTRQEHCPYVGLILQALPFARVIYCRRDPLDNCLFIYFKRYPSGSPNFYDLRSMASYYADYREMMAHWLRLYGDRILDVRYEDLVRNPAASCARLYEYCGLDYDPRTIHCALKTDEIGHWKHYESYLGPLRQALCGLTR